MDDQEDRLTDTVSSDPSDWQTLEIPKKGLAVSARMKGKPRAVLTVTGSVYHQPVAQGVGVGTVGGKPFQRLLLTDEQPYGPRWVKVGREWTDLDTGPRDWVSVVGYIQVESVKGTLLWGVDGKAIGRLRQGEESRFEPVAALQVMLEDVATDSLDAGEGQYKITVFPD